MAEEFQTGISCSGGWWSSSTRGGFDVSAVPTTTATCSLSVSEAGAYGWPAAGEAMEGKGRRSGDDSVATASGSSSVTFQDAPSVHVSDPMATGGFLLESSSLPMADFSLASPTADWSHTLLRSGGGRVDHGGFHAMLQDDLSSRSYFRQQEAVMESNHVLSGSTAEPMNPFKGMNHGFMLDQSHVQLSSGGDSGECPTTSLLQGLFDQEVKPQRQPNYDNRSTPTNFMAPMTYNRLSSSEDPSQAPPAAWSRFPQFLKGSPPKQPHQQQQPSHHLQFSNNTPFWNASAAAVTDARSGFYTPPQAPFASHQKFDEKSISSAVTSKLSASSEGRRESTSGGKKSGNEPAQKKPRVETPSSLPTFKVRKEKLGDRITALQQLVSPFGKTDTASVLYEAIEYIKFLHEQVNVLSTPYLKNGQPMQHHQQSSEKLKDGGDGPKQDLRSRGLCLVPISSTFAVANEPMSEFWTPTFGGTYR